MSPAFTGSRHMRREVVFGRLVCCQGAKLFCGCAVVEVPVGSEIVEFVGEGVVPAVDSVEVVRREVPRCVELVSPCAVVAFDGAVEFGGSGLEFEEVDFRHTNSLGDSHPAFTSPASHMCLNQITDSVTGNPPVSKPRESPLFIVFANRLSVRPLLRKPGSVRSPSPVAVGSRGSRCTTAARVAAGGDGGIAAARPDTRIARRPRQPRHGRCRILWVVLQFRVTRSNRFIELPGKLRQVLDGLITENILPFDQP